MSKVAEGYSGNTRAVKQKQTLMRTASRLSLSMMGFCLATVLICNCQNMSAKAEFDLGVSAYKQAKYEEAIRHFLSPRQVVATGKTAQTQVARTTVRPVTEFLSVLR